MTCNVSLLNSKKPEKSSGEKHGVKDAGKS
jgi:hypothetical protein